MKLHQKLITVLSILVAINLPLFAQTTPVKPLPINKPKAVVPLTETAPKIEPLTVEAAPTPTLDSKALFRREIIKAAASAQKKGLIKRLDVVRLRVAVLSPAFLSKTEDLAVIQMSASGEEGPFETSDTGEIIRETINWEGLATFLEKLIPLILALLSTFGA